MLTASVCRNDLWDPNPRGTVGFGVWVCGTGLLVLSREDGNFIPKKSLYCITPLICIPSFPTKPQEVGVCRVRNGLSSLTLGMDPATKGP